MKSQIFLRQGLCMAWMLVFLVGCGPNAAPTSAPITAATLALATSTRTPSVTPTAPANPVLLTETATATPSSTLTPPPPAGNGAPQNSTDTREPRPKKTETPTATPTPTATRHVTITATPFTPTVTATIDPAHPVTGFVLIEGGNDATGGTAGETIQIDTALSATSPYGTITQMRVWHTYGGDCYTDAQLAGIAWQPFAPSDTYSVTLAINWIGFYVSAQFQDDHGYLSPAYCDDISVEGMPPITPHGSPTALYSQIQCFSRYDVRPSPGQTVTGAGVTFSWPDTNNLPDGVFYKVFAYGQEDQYASEVVSGQTRDTAVTLPLPAERAGDIAWYVTLVDANGYLIDHGQCSSFPASLLKVDPPTGIKGIHFQYRP